MTSAWLDRLGGLAFDVGVAAAALWSFVALATLASRQPARRLRIARAAALGSIALPLLIGLGLAPRLLLLETSRDLGLLALPFLPEPWHPAPYDPDPNPDLDLDRTPLADLPAWSLHPRAGRLLTVVYASGVATALAWLALGHALLAALARGTDAPSPASLHLYESLPYRRRGRRPRLRVSTRVATPVIVGPLRPTILIPPRFDLPEHATQLRLGLLHELAHAENLDPTFGLLDGLARALWFPIPPFWWVASRARLDQEFLADRRASETFGPPVSYASTLLELAAAAPRDPAAGPGEPLAPRPEPTPSGAPLVQRLLMLLRCPFPVETRPPAPWAFLLAGLTIPVTIAAASITLRPLPTPPPQPPRNHAFHLTRLEVPPTHPGPGGRSPSFELPINLPPAFDLRLELWASPQTLHRNRVAGLSLNLGDPGPTPSSNTLPTWHPIRLTRDPQGLTLWLDDHPRRLAPDALADLTPQLTVEPAPNLVGSYRNLTLTW